MMIYTGTTISFQFGGKFQQAHNSHPSFSRIVELAKKGDFAEASRLIDLKEVVARSLAGSKATLRDSNVYYDGELVRSTLAHRIITMAREGFDATPLLLFLENLMSNPSKRAVDELYDFLEASSLPITDDGHFLAYKSVRQDFTDHRTGSMDNSVGAIVEMPRNKVDEDKNRTCSAGLHFAAHNYAKRFGSSGRMVVLKINPRDVVAIPSDYNNEKGRACRYEILEEVQRSDTKLVDKGFVATKGAETKVTFEEPKTKFPVGTRVYIRPESQYYGISMSNPGGVAGVVVPHEPIALPIKVQWENGQVNTYNESDLTTENPTYIPQSDNYKDDNVWNQFSDTFVGNTKEFPVNRDVAYNLWRQSNDKDYYRVFFCHYDESNDNLVFKYMKEGDVAYCTVADLSDWEISLA